MAIIYSYPTKAAPDNEDLILISDSSSTNPKNQTKQIKISSLPGGSTAGVSSFSTGSSGLTVNAATGGVVINGGGLNASFGGTGHAGGYNNGDMLYAQSSTVLTKLNIGDTGQVLSVNASGRPEWLASPAMSSFSVVGDSGTTETITNNQELSIVGGTGIATTSSASDTITINAVYPTVTTLTGASALGIKGTAGGQVSFVAGGNLATVLKIGELVIIQFYMQLANNGSPAAAAGDMIITNLPHAVAAAGNAVAQGSGVVTLNTSMGSGVGFPHVIRPGDSGVNTEANLYTNPGLSGGGTLTQSAKSQWSATGESGWILSGTMQYFAATAS